MDLDTLTYTQARNAERLAVKERPILFNAPMVKAILSGAKTQTRRVVKPPGGWGEQYPHCDPFAMPPAVWWWNGVHERVGVRQECLYGKPGDRLWLTQEAGSWKGMSKEDRFWGRILKTDGCWEWMGQTNRKRYGVIKVGPRDYSTHRLSWEIANGRVPEGKHVLHHCDVPWCVRPDHLYLGTNAENISDKVMRGRTAKMTGSRNGGARLTEHQVIELRRLYEYEDWKQARLAAFYGISQGQVSKILSGARWRDELISEVTRPIGHRTLEITAVRVERLQEISSQDAIAEGIERISDANYWAWNDYTGNGQKLSPCMSFQSLWESIKGPGSWEANPWVWVIEFARCAQ